MRRVPVLLLLDLQRGATRGTGRVRAALAVDASATPSPGRSRWSSSPPAARCGARRGRCGARADGSGPILPRATDAARWRP